MKSLPKPYMGSMENVPCFLLHAYSGSPNDVRMLCRFWKNLSIQSMLLYLKDMEHWTLKIFYLKKRRTGGRTHKSDSVFKIRRLFSNRRIWLINGRDFAVRALADESLIGGGFFCSPISPVENHVPEKF